MPKTAQCEEPVTPTPSAAPAASASSPTSNLPSIFQPVQMDPNAPAQWRNRRRMAYLAMISMMVLIGAMFLPSVSVERIKAMENICEWYLITCGSIVAAYTGFATYSAVKLSQTK